MTDFLRVAPSGDVTSRGFSRVRADQREILLVRVADGTVAAFNLACPHQGHSMGQGGLSPEGDIECPHHFYCYDPTTGQNTWPGDEDDPRLPLFEVREHDGWIWVRLGG